MIKCHPKVDDANYSIHLQRETYDLEVAGYESDKILRILFNVFTWMYMEGNIHGIADCKIKDFLLNYDLTAYMGNSPVYSAILLYNKLSKDINLRELENNRIEKIAPGDNKILTNVNFEYKELLELYKSNAGDISKDFLLFNDLFRIDHEKEVLPLVNYGEITKVSSLVDMVKPDLSYKLVSRQLQVNRNVEVNECKKNKIYVLQDCTYSIQDYIPNIKTIKAFILNEAFKHDFEVDWLYISNKINDRTLYTAKTISTDKIDFELAGSVIDTSKILIEDEFINKQVIIITDGTDSFNFPFNTKTKKISVISFLDNEEIKNKISNYGRFFKVKLS